MVAPLKLIALAALLSGCASNSTVITSAAQPIISQDAARKAIIANRSVWKDPDSIKEARAGQPYACTSDSIDGFSKAPASCVCIELNARNSYDGYTGVQRTIAVFPESGGFSTLDGGTKGFQEYCHNLRPFPELNGRR